MYPEIKEQELTSLFDLFLVKNVPYTQFKKQSAESGMSGTETGLSLS